MKKMTGCLGAAAFALACTVCMPVQAGAAAPAKAESEAVLGNVDGPDAEEPPAAEQPAAPAGDMADKAAAATDADAAAQAEEKAKKPDPLTQHRMEMLQQVTPDNYMNSNQSTSRRYLMIDRNTYQSRMSE